MNDELFALCSKQACLRCPLSQGKRVLNRVGSSLTNEALPAALCPSGLPQNTAARLVTIPSAALRSLQGKKKKERKKKNKKKNPHVVIAQAQATARGGPAQQGEAGNERGSDGPPAPGPLGTVVFVKKHAPYFGCHGLADPPKQANGITQ